MDAADKIGLLWGFGWIADHGFLWTLLLCFLITPIMHLLVGAILEDRFVPLKPSKQFLSFFPGDLFLGLTATILLMQAQSLPAESAWYNSGWWHGLVLASTTIIALLMTYFEYRSKAYPARAMFSPTKLYHNIVLYAGFGYIVFSTFIAVLFGNWWSWWILLPVVPFLIWLFLLFLDGRAEEDAAIYRRIHAHVPDWTPVWRSRHVHRGY